MRLIKFPVLLVIFAVMSVSACSSSSESASADVLMNADQFEISEFEAIPEWAPDNDQALVLDDSGNSDSTIEYLKVNPHLVECEGYQIGHCFQVQREGEDRWVYLYEMIEGFEFEWGTEYEILVQIQQATPVFPMDSALKYTLLEVLSTTQRTGEDTFAYTARDSQIRIVELDQQEFSLLGRKSFVCRGDQCDNLRSAMAQNQSALLSFKYSSTPAAPLLLDAVLCADAAHSFTESCLQD
jgi:hypothetical protein